MAGDVRQCLLRDAVHDQLERRARAAADARSSCWLDVEAESLGEPLAQDGERALEPEVVERLGPQLDRDPPHVLEAAAHRALNLERRRLAARRERVPRPAPGRAEPPSAPGPTWSCSSWAIRRRSASWPASTLPVASRRSASSRASISLNVNASSPASEAGVGRRHPLAVVGEIDAPGERRQRLHRTNDAANQVHVERDRRSAARRSARRPPRRRETTTPGPASSTTIVTPTATTSSSAFRPATR